VAPAQPAPTVSAPGGDLDLSTPAPTPATVSAAPAAADRAEPKSPARVRPVRRVGPGPATILSPKAPTAALTRVQSGVGVLTIEAACSAAAGDLELGCAYQLTSGASSLARAGHNATLTVANSKRPLITVERAQFEHLIVDLSLVTSISRMVVYAFSAQSAVLNWGGTLVITTFGQSRIEIPIDHPPSADTLAIASLYNVGGEFVIRAELEAIPGTLRDAAIAFGFDRISWLDAQTPMS
jgi:uncharacterized protein involved in tellurium resistance